MAALEAIFRFGWLALMSVEILLHEWPAGMLLVGGMIAAGLLGLKLDKDRTVRAWLWGLSPLGLSFSILMCGAVFWGTDLGNNLRLAVAVIHFLLLAHI